jgi:hypothetical protein
MSTCLFSCFKGCLSGRFSLAFLMVFLSSLVCHAESPPCICTVDAMKVEISPALPCLTISTANAEVCTGTHTQLKVENRCLETAILGNTRNMNQGPTEQTFSTGGTGYWAEVFADPIGSGQSKPVSLKRILRHGLNVHTVRLEGRVTCSAPKKTKTSSGCSISALGDSSLGVEALLLGILILVGVKRKSNLSARF